MEVNQSSASSIAFLRLRLKKMGVPLDLDSGYEEGIGGG